MEYAFEHAAEVLGVDPMDLKRANFIQAGQEDIIGINPLPEMIDQLM